MDTAAVGPAAWAGLGAGLVLLLQQTPCLRAAGSRVGAGAGRPGGTQLVVGRLAHSDAAGRTFVLDGYRAIQAVEGRSFQEVTDEEMDAVAADLEATLSSGDSSRQGGVLFVGDPVDAAAVPLLPRAPSRSAVPKEPSWFSAIVHTIPPNRIVRHVGD